MKQVSRLILISTCALAAVPAWPLLPPPPLQIAPTITVSDEIVTGTLREIGEPDGQGVVAATLTVDTVIAGSAHTASRSVQLRWSASDIPAFFTRPGCHGIFFLKHASGSTFVPISPMLPAFVTVAAGAGEVVPGGVEANLVQALRATIGSDDAALSAAVGMPEHADPGNGAVVRYDALHALFQLSGTVALPALRSLAASPVDAVRLQGAAGLAHFGDYTPMAALGPMLKDPPAAQRFEVEDVAREFAYSAGNAEKRAIALTLVDSHDSAIRLAGMEVLREMATRADIAVLARRIDDPYQLVRFNAVVTLERLSGQPEVGLELFGENEPALITQSRQWAALQLARH